MLLLRREYRDGAEPPEIVLLHAEVTRRRKVRRPDATVHPGGRSLGDARPTGGAPSAPRAGGGGADPRAIPVLHRSRRGRTVLSVVRGGRSLGRCDRGSLPHPRGGDVEPPARSGTRTFPPGPAAGGGGARVRPVPVRLRRDAEKAVPVALPRRHRRGIRSGAGHRGPGGPLGPQEPADAVLPVPRLRGRETARRQDRVRPHHLRRSRRDRRLRPDGLGRLRVAGHEPLPHGGQGVRGRPVSPRPGNFSRKTGRRFSRRGRPPFPSCRFRASSRRSCSGLRGAGWSIASRPSRGGRTAASRCGGGTGKAGGTGS